MVTTALSVQYCHICGGLNCPAVERIYSTAFALVISLFCALYSDQIKEKRVEQSVKDAFNDQVLYRD